MKAFPLVKRCKQTTAPCIRSNLFSLTYIYMQLTKRWRINVKISAFFFVVLATEYNRIITFKEPIPNKVLPGHVIRTEKVVDEGSCRVKCYMEPNCVSFNVGPEEVGGRTCELKNFTNESFWHSALEERKDYIHYAVEVHVLHCFATICDRYNDDKLMETLHIYDNYMQKKNEVIWLEMPPNNAIVFEMLYYENSDNFQSVH